MVHRIRVTCEGKDADMFSYVVGTMITQLAMMRHRLEIVAIIKVAHA